LGLVEKKFCLRRPGSFSWMCCNFVVEPKVGVDDRKLSSSTRELSDEEDDALILHDAEVATVRHDRSQHGADVFGGSLLALSGREEIAGKAKLIVDFDQEVGQLHAAHLLCQPGFEAGQTILFLLFQFLGGVGGQAPAILVNHGVVVARPHLESKRLTNYTTDDVGVAGR